MRRFRCYLLLALLMPSAASARAEDRALNGSVTIYRDTWGVPHIYAKTPAEGAYGLGYAQAGDRLDDIYRNLRTGLGRMSEAFGKKWVDQDYIMRICRNEELAKSYWKTAPPHIKAVCTGFTAGIERYVAEHPETAPKYAFKIEPWQVLTVGRAMILNWPLGTIKTIWKTARRSNAGPSTCRCAPISGAWLRRDRPTRWPFCSPIRTSIGKAWP
jgi:acyl-homoserine lactone acylase PvdQ